MDTFWEYALVGFFAQLVDGSLGMGFGVISSAVLLAQGVPPPLVRYLAVARVQSPATL